MKDVTKNHLKKAPLSVQYPKGLGRLSVAYKNQVRLLFQGYDGNADGSLERHEVRSFVRDAVSHLEKQKQPEDRPSAPVLLAWLQRRYGLESLSELGLSRFLTTCQNWFGNLCSNLPTPKHHRLGRSRSTFDFLQTQDSLARSTSLTTFPTSVQMKMLPRTIATNDPKVPRRESSELELLDHVRHTSVQIKREQREALTSVHDQLYAEVMIGNVIGHLTKAFVSGQQQVGEPHHHHHKSRESSALAKKTQLSQQLKSKSRVAQMNTLARYAQHERESQTRVLEKQSQQAKCQAWRLERKQEKRQRQRAYQERQLHTLQTVYAAKDQVQLQLIENRRQEQLLRELEQPALRRFHLSSYTCTLESKNKPEQPQLSKEPMGQYDAQLRQYQHIRAQVRESALKEKESSIVVMDGPESPAGDVKCLSPLKEWPTSVESSEFEISELVPPPNSPPNAMRFYGRLPEKPPTPFGSTNARLTSLGSSC